jgi:diadenosine tetraphosphate (Ap4A) HIT family hydrolase
MDTKFELHEMLEADTVTITELPLCRVLLMNDSLYPWLILVPKVNGIKEIFELDWQDQIQLQNESSLVAEMLNEMFEADKINVAALGNMCPQLHVHHIVRYKSDASWPNPVWGAAPKKEYTGETLNELVGKLTTALDSITVR